MDVWFAQGFFFEPRLVFETDMSGWDAAHKVAHDVCKYLDSLGGYYTCEVVEVKPYSFKSKHESRP